MTNSNTTLQATSAQPDAEGFRRYHIVPSGFGASRAVASVNSEYGGDSCEVFDDEDVPGMQGIRDIKVGGRAYKYVQWGSDDQLPYRVRKEIMSNMVTAQCQQFNVTSCYGQGLRFVDRKTKSDVSRSEEHTSELQSQR